jgi:hypothetical protein
MKPIPTAMALLTAGLCLFRGPALADEPTPFPARRAAPAVTPTPWPSPAPSATPLPVVHPEELKAEAAALRAELGLGLKSAADSNAQLDKQLNELGEKIRAISGSQEDDRSKLARQGENAKAFGEALEASQAKLNESLKKIEEVRAQIEGKGARMEGLLDLVNTLKRDINDNSFQIAELKREFEGLKKAEQQPAEEDWWGQLVGWRYLPMAATVLGGVALGIAASHK